MHTAMHTSFSTLTSHNYMYFCGIEDFCLGKVGTGWGCCGKKHGKRLSASVGRRPGGMGWSGWDIKSNREQNLSKFRQFKFNC